MTKNYSHYCTNSTTYKREPNDSLLIPNRTDLKHSSKQLSKNYIFQQTKLRLGNTQLRKKERNMSPPEKNKSNNRKEKNQDKQQPEQYIHIYIYIFIILLPWRREHITLYTAKYGLVIKRNENINKNLLCSGYEEYKP